MAKSPGAAEPVFQDISVELSMSSRVTRRRVESRPGEDGGLTSGNGWVTMENPIEMDDLGGPPFMGVSINGPFPQRMGYNGKSY